MNNIHTLSDLLKNSGCQYLIFDLGRRIQPIDSSAFNHIEQGQQAYPYPVQRKAHLAIAYWNESRQPWIWFLKFELDERGLLKQADIGNFIKYVVEAMGTHLSQEMSEEQQEKLSNNPYTFKPAEDKMAVFHSKIRANLELETSQYYSHAQDYFAGKLGWEKWQTVGLQGITDVCARMNEQQNSVHLIRALKQLPNEPLYALLGTLEHCDLPDRLAEPLSDMAMKQINSSEPDLFLLSALTRALTSANHAFSLPVLQAILNSPLLSHQEILIGIAGRCWHLLADTKLAEQFLIRLAETNNQALFNQLFADLVMLPELRVILLPLLHSSPTEELARALENLQQAARKH
ncbi:DUF3549 family protein [Vibrio marisflavi]|uniref:DUF3549 domain-containing protein n=1 Tax=Vibrio marisflavi CECT 7928 TaxID=634439 RepID=A0ABN8E1L7_9VIBR|nr:DUF3549 family protein [Vibrio marisflavi]CAH0538899.1 hypothetical protein VMF7928_01746 [Vibrio marisflavi CECT 7928]